MNPKKIILREDEMPTQWYNICPDIPNGMQPPLDPGTKEPIAPEKLAEDKMLRSTRTLKGVKFYINRLTNKLVRFKNQNDENAQKNQIIEEEISKSVKYKRDIAESVYNYLEFAFLSDL